MRLIQRFAVVCIRTTTNFFTANNFDNVIIQIKNGPIDFQVREPASPLFGAMDKTREAIELQITQEYFGQARHLVFLPGMWKETLDFDMHVRDRVTIWIHPWTTHKVYCPLSGQLARQLGDLGIPDELVPRF